MHHEPSFGSHINRLADGLSSIDVHCGGHRRCSRENGALAEPPLCILTSVAEREKKHSIPFTLTVGIVENLCNPKVLYPVEIVPIHSVYSMCNTHCVCSVCFELYSRCILGHGGKQPVH